MRHNVIILTPGLSGSSVLAGLISRSGYCVGNSTAMLQYNTFEDVSLVSHNISILRQTGYMWEDPGDLPPPSIDRITALSQQIDTTPYYDYIKECDSRPPWLWKDPRLSYTIHFWKSLIDIDRCKFILLTRDLKQCWTGTILRARLPVARKNQSIVLRNAIDSAMKLLDSCPVNPLVLKFEDLLLRPEAKIDEINSFLDINLSLADLRETYHDNLYRIRWNYLHQLKAYLYFRLYKAAGKELSFPRSR